MEIRTNTFVDFLSVFFHAVCNSIYKKGREIKQKQKEKRKRWAGDNLEANGKSDWDNGTGQNTYRNRNMRPNPDGRNMRTVWSINTKPFPDAHFAVFPETLVERMIKSGCPENGLVLDPFMGAGTTAVAARKLNRNYTGFELNPKYKLIAENRLIKEVGLFL